MDTAEQRMLLEAWRRYRRGQNLSNTTMVDFYFDVVKDLPGARHGMAYEVFDLIINGPFELDAGLLERWQRAAAVRAPGDEDVTRAA